MGISFCGEGSWAPVSDEREDQPPGDVSVAWEGMGSPSGMGVGTACLGVACLCVAESLLCVYVCVCTSDSGSRSSPISWESLQVSWELGCFCLWFDLGRGVPNLRNYPLRSPRKHLCVLFPWGPTWRVQGVGLPLASLVPAGRGCPWKEFYPVT